MAAADAARSRESVSLLRVGEALAIGTLSVWPTTLIGPGSGFSAAAIRRSIGASVSASVVPPVGKEARRRRTAMSPLSGTTSTSPLAISGASAVRMR